MRALLLLRKQDFENAAPLVDEALSLTKEPGSNDQSLLLLSADCAHGLKRGPAEAELLQRTMALGPIPLERSTTLIAYHLPAGQADRALLHLRASTQNLPNDPAVLCRYTAFWEQLRDDTQAQLLWKHAITADGHSEAAYVGLSANHLRSNRNSDALRVAEQGLIINSKSDSLLLTKEQALEAVGDLRAARRFLTEHAASKNTQLLERRARVEDWYGVGGADAYMALLDALVANQQSPPASLETSRH